MNALPPLYQYMISEKDPDPVAGKMKKIKLYGVMIIGLAVPVLVWARTLTPGLPWSATLYDIGRLLALLSFVLISFQYVLSSKVKWIERGVGLDHLFEIHKKLGMVILSFVLAHPVLLLLSERLQGQARPIGLLKILGILTLLALFVAACGAILYGKVPMQYETWKRIHKAGYATLPMAFVHSFFMGSAVQKGLLKLLWLILLLVYLTIWINKIWQRSYIRRHPFKIAAASRETHDTWSLQFEGDPGDYTPGQFMIVQLVRDGKVSAPHPFTIASSPTRQGLSICVKSAGDFTSTIKHTTTSDLAYIDMPYGAFSFLYHDAESLVFIAGGIGVTPFMSMLRYIYDRRLEKRVILMWANKTEGDIVFRDELEKMASDMPGFKVVHVMSREDEWPGEKGRIDEEKLKRYVGNFQSGQFFICGPPLMMGAIKRRLSDLGVPRGRIQTERFALR